MALNNSQDLVKKNLVMKSKNHLNNCQLSILDFNTSPTLENLLVLSGYLFIGKTFSSNSKKNIETISVLVFQNNIYFWFQF